MFPVVSSHMTTRLRLAAILLAPALILAVTAPAGAAPTRRSVEQQLDKLSEQISAVDEQYNEARLQLQKVLNQVRDTQRRKAEADATLTSLRIKASAHGVAVYRAGLPKVLQVLLSSQDMTDFQRRMTLLTRIADWESGLIESLELAQARADRVGEELQQNLTKRRKIESALGAKRREIERSITDQKALLARIDAASRPRRAVSAAPQIDYAALPVSEKAKVAVQVALAQIGKPYRYAAAGPNAFDCSGLTMYSWGKAGVYLPHSSRAQYSATPRVSRANLQPGDLVFFYSPIHHVGMYIGGGRMVHAVSDGNPVRIDDLDYAGHYVGAGRPGV